MDKEQKNFLAFVYELRHIARVSRVYAIAAWYTLPHWRRRKPEEAAAYYKRYNNL